MSDLSSTAVYRSLLQDKLSKVYECLSLIEDPLPLSSDSREKIRTLLETYSRYLSLKLKISYEDN